MNCQVQWILYGEEFRKHCTWWIMKVQNRIMDFSNYEQVIASSDVICYQEVVQEKSTFCNSVTIGQLKKPSAQLIKFPSFFFKVNESEESIRALVERETRNSVDITVSNIIQKNPAYYMISEHHPSTSLLLEVLRELCKRLNIPFFSQTDCAVYTNNPNYMELPN
jgi:hypothetical protein